MKIYNKGEFLEQLLDICLTQHYLRSLRVLKQNLAKTDYFKKEYLYVKENSNLFLECLEEIKPLLSKCVVGSVSHEGEYPSSVYDYWLDENSDLDEFCRIVNFYLEKVHFGYLTELIKSNLIKRIKYIKRGYRNEY